MFKFGKWVKLPPSKYYSKELSDVWILPPDIESQKLMTEKELHDMLNKKNKTTDKLLKESIENLFS